MSINLGKTLAQRAGTSPMVEAYLEPGTGLRLNYRQVNERANQYAALLSELGIAAGDRVATLLPNGIDFIALFYGAAKLGAIVVRSPDGHRLILAGRGCGELCGPCRGRNSYGKQLD